MISTGEIYALERALADYTAYAARLRAVADGAGFGLWLTGARGRMDQIADDAAANVERFRQRRDELVQQEPTDHEAILAYVDGINEATGTRLAEAMAAELEVSDPAGFVAAVASDTISDLKVWLALGLAAALVLLYVTRR